MYTKGKQHIQKVNQRKIQNAGNNNQEKHKYIQKSSNK